MNRKKLGRPLKTIFILMIQYPHSSFNVPTIDRPLTVLRLSSNHPSSANRPSSNFETDGRWMMDGQWTGGGRLVGGRSSGR